MARVILAMTLAVSAIACGRNSVTVESTSPSTSSSQGTTSNTAKNPVTSPPRQNLASVRGAVSGLTGTCPSIAFTVSATKVMTTSATRFERHGCASVANGVSVRVAGTKQTDGSIAAAHVDVDKDHQ